MRRRKSGRERSTSARWLRSPSPSRTRTTRRPIAPSAMPVSAELICVLHETVPQFWPHCTALIRRAMERGSAGDFASVERCVLSAKALLWIAWDGAKIISAAVTQIDKFGDVKVCTIVACGGSELNNFLPLIAGIEKYAKIEGCELSRIDGRPGWARVLPSYRIARV